MAADPVTKSTVDDLSNYDIDSDDPFGEKTATAKPRDDKPTLSPRAAKRRAGADDADALGLDLGLDQEVKIKKRKPNPKLDEALLLSKPGISKLRAHAKDGVSKKLRLKCKGHEFSDAAKLLNYFHLWLDDLYPRAKFADGLQLVEKVGHSKRMQVMRREWINELKRKELYGDDDMYSGQTRGIATNAAPPTSAATATSLEQSDPPEDHPNSDDLFFPDANMRPEVRRNNEPEEDELDALLAEQENTIQAKPQQRPLVDDSEGQDDLDALFAEAERSIGKSSPARKNIEDVEKQDDLDALLAEQDARPELAPTARPQAHDEDDEDLDALMAE